MSSKPGCVRGGPTTPRSASRTRPRTQRHSGWIWTRFDRCSPTTSRDGETCMTIDLTGGIGPDREYMFAERPDNPEMRDSASFWVFDDRGQVGLPRVGIEAVAANWDAHGIQVNVAFPDGRVYRLREGAASLPVGGPRGQ